MRLLLTDTPLPIQFSEGSENYLIDLSSQKISHCVGCFGCWVKTPGKCVIRDDATKIYPLIAKSEEVLYVSRVKYGSYDTPMKTMLERAIPVQQAFLRIHHGETHHVQRAVAVSYTHLLETGKETGRAPLKKQSNLIKNFRFYSSIFSSSVCSCASFAKVSSLL